MPEGSLKDEIWLGTEEIDAILNRTLYANSRDKARQKTGIPGKGGSRRSFNPPETRTYHGAAKQAPQEEYLLVDGYNIIYAWEELNLSLIHIWCWLITHTLFSPAGRRQSFHCPEQSASGQSNGLPWQSFHLPLLGIMGYCNRNV